MKENIYAIVDRESGIALKPFIIQRNDVAPVREFEDLCTNKETMFNKHAGDFELMHLGEVDLETLEIIGLTPRTVARAIDLIDKE